MIEACGNSFFKAVGLSNSVRLSADDGLSCTSKNSDDQLIVDTGYSSCSTEPCDPPSGQSQARFENICQY